MTSETTQSNDANSASSRKEGGVGYVVPLVLALVGISVYLNVFRGPVGPPPGWGNDFSAALAEAKETDKPVVVVFYADG